MPNDKAIIDSDLKVIASLMEAGDPLRLVREVKHWAYFSSRIGADMFARWLADDDLDDIVIIEDSSYDEDLVWRVTYTHEIKPTLEAITAHTIPAVREAERLGGRYSGWETSVEAV